MEKDSLKHENCLHLHINDEDLVFNIGGQKKVFIGLAEGNIKDASWTWTNLWSFLKAEENCLMSSVEAYPELYKGVLERF